MVHVQTPGNGVVPPTLSVFVAVRSGAVTLTESLNALFTSLVSTMTLAGSTDAVPAARGFANVPTAVGVAVKRTSTAPPGARAADPPLAVHVRSKLPLIAHTTV